MSAEAVLRNEYMTSNHDRYHRVFEYIDQHLDEALNVERLSQVACLSKYHFHRQFSALYGISVGAYITLLRLKRASFQLEFRDNESIVEIAFAAGYESPEAFSRAFTRSMGQSPSAFRKQSNNSSWQHKYESIAELRQKVMTEKTYTPEVSMVDFPETPIAVLAHKGPVETLGHTIQQFIGWRKQHHTRPGKSKTFNIVYDDPAHTEPEQYRFDICASHKGPVADNSYGVIYSTIPKGRCALIRHIGPVDIIEQAIAYLYDEWLNNCNEELRDFSLFFERIAFFPDVPESEVITDIYLPLR